VSTSAGASIPVPSRSAAPIKAMTIRGKALKGGAHKQQHDHDKPVQWLGHREARASRGSSPALG
jgi:hypothetical protein